MKLTDKRKYEVRDSSCYKKECFTPFLGNGVKICRLYELGKCKY